MTFLQYSAFKLVHNKPSHQQNCSRKTHHHCLMIIHWLLNCRDQCSCLSPLQQGQKNQGLMSTRLPNGFCFLNQIKRNCNTRAATKNIWTNCVQHESQKSSRANHLSLSLIIISLTTCTKHLEHYVLLARGGGDGRTPVDHWQAPFALERPWQRCRQSWHSLSSHLPTGLWLQGSRPCSLCLWAAGRRFQ